MPKGIYDHSKHDPWNKGLKGTYKLGPNQTPLSDESLANIRAAAQKRGAPQAFLDNRGSGMLGKRHTKESNEKNRKSQFSRTFDEQFMVNHHMWYEDNDGNPTDKGLWQLSRELHPQIHAVLRHNKWTNNRRYLAG